MPAWLLPSPCRNAQNGVFGQSCVTDPKDCPKVCLCAHAGLPFLRVGLTQRVYASRKPIPFLGECPLRSRWGRGHRVKNAPCVADGGAKSRGAERPTLIRTLRWQKFRRRQHVGRVRRMTRPRALRNDDDFALVPNGDVHHVVQPVIRAPEPTAIRERPRAAIAGLFGLVAAYRRPCCHREVRQLGRLLANFGGKPGSSGFPEETRAQLRSTGAGAADGARLTIGSPVRAR